VTETYNAAWYDEVLIEDGSPAMEPLETSPWLETYERVAKMIDPHEEVVDLGCGTGRFIELLRRNGHYALITGVDWSAAALEEAFGYATTKDFMPSFRREDLREWRPDGLRAGNTVYTCTEVLEHLEDDLGLVRRIPPGHRFLFTVPNFDSESHVRTFARVGDLWERYAGLLMFRSWSMAGSERKGIHVVEAVRRADAW
jgi:2-polyprenyl-3-methyl-5-hydroxy-6-metoxy-1,4-benzoquinol methylase